MDPLGYYRRPEIQRALLDGAKAREVAGVTASGAFLQRPNALLYPADVPALAAAGALEFHASLERWRNPMALREGNYAELRTGWDLILDLDCERTEHGIIAAQSILEFLQRFGLRAVSVKFTGGTGFHIGIPWESLPPSIGLKPTVQQYPELARAMGQYIKEKIRSDFAARLLARWSPGELAEASSKKPEELLLDGNFDPFLVVSIDPILISPRHLVRMAYSLHASGRVSLPLLPAELSGFRPESALPEAVGSIRPFLAPGEPEEAAALAVEAWDWASRARLDWHGAEAVGEAERIAARLKQRAHATVVTKGAERLTRTRVLGRRSGEFSQPVPKELFPPCMHNILKGLSDGRKRALFLLLNFLAAMRWEWPAIEAEVLAWNERNQPALKDGYVRTQLRWHQRQSKLPVARCTAPGRYISIGVCAPDALCGGESRSIGSPRRYPAKAIRARKQ